MCGINYRRINQIRFSGGREFLGNLQTDETMEIVMSENV